MTAEQTGGSGEAPPAGDSGAAPLARDSGAAPLARAAWLRAPATRRVLQALEAGGRPARFVGGCVRDGLLGRLPPGGEFDLATPELPEQVLRRLEAAGLAAIPTGLAHGTVSTVVDGQRFEITTLRQDLACDGRHAEVAFTEDFAADAARRDLTINAMSCDGAGRLFDYFGGRADLAAGRVRFVGRAAERIAEDYLRILRFFRFFAHYGRPPADAEALAAAAAAAPELKRLSGERIQAEMLRLLAADDPLPALRLMAETGVLAEVIPGPVALDRLAGLLAVAPEADPLLRLAALLRPPPAPPEAAAAVASRWRLSSRAAERLAALTTTPLPPLTGAPAARRRALYRLGAQTYADLARLAAAEPPDQAAAGPPHRAAAGPPHRAAAGPPHRAAARPPHRAVAEQSGQAAAEPPDQTAAEPPGRAAAEQSGQAAAERSDRAALAAALAAAAAWQPQKLPVTGDDLIALGVPQGPRMGALLAALEAWWLAHDLTPDRAACLAQARSLIAREGLGGPAS